MLNILLIPISFLTGAAYFMEEWYAGANKKHILLGRGLGKLEVPYELLDGLKKEHDAR